LDVEGKAQFAIWLEMSDWKYFPKEAILHFTLKMVNVFENTAFLEGSS